MRLHPAVATALVLVGGLLLALPLHAWLRSPESPSELFGPARAAPGLMSAVLGLVFVFVGVLFSIETRSGSGRPD